MGDFIKATVLRPFIASTEKEDEGEKKKANAQGVVPHGLHHPGKRHLVETTVVDLTPQRFKELSDLQIVKRFDDKSVQKPVGKAVDK